MGSLSLYYATETEKNQHYCRDDFEDFNLNLLTNCLFEQLHMHLSISGTNSNCIGILKCELRDNSNLHENIKELQNAISKNIDKN